MSSTFEFSPKNLEKFHQILGRYPVKRAAMLPTLHLAQEQAGYIGAEVEEYVSKLLEVPVVDVREVLSFYTLFFQKPMGRCHIRLCMSIACWIRGADQIKEHLEKEIQTQQGEPTEDGVFSWEAVPDCLGACELAPMMQVAGYFEGPLSPELIDQILARERDRN